MRSPRSLYMMSGASAPVTHDLVSDHESEHTGAFPTKSERQMARSEPVVPALQWLVGPMRI
jgi:hypothetical protein